MRHCSPYGDCHQNRCASFPGLSMRMNSNTGHHSQSDRTRLPRTNDRPATKTKHGRLSFGNAISNTSHTNETQANVSLQLVVGSVPNGLLRWIKGTSTTLGRDPLNCAIQGKSPAPSGRMVGGSSKTGSTFRTSGIEPKRIAEQSRSWCSPSVKPGHDEVYRAHALQLPLGRAIHERE